MMIPSFPASMLSSFRLASFHHKHLPDENCLSERYFVSHSGQLLCSPVLSPPRLCISYGRSRTTQSISPHALTPGSSSSVMQTSAPHDYSFKLPRKTRKINLFSFWRHSSDEDHHDAEDSRVHETPCDQLHLSNLFPPPKSWEEAAGFSFWESYGKMSPSIL